MYFTSAKHKNSFFIEPVPTDPAAARVARKSDRVLLVSIIMLMMVGLLAVYSSIAYFAESSLSSTGSLVGSHIVKIIIAFLVIVIFSKIDYHYLLRFSRIALILSWLFLIIVTLYGTEVFGARRSLNIGGISFQPSAMATVALLVHVVTLVTSKASYIKDFTRGFLPIMVWVLITCALIGLEDFSSAVVLLILSLTIMFIGRASIWHIGVLLIIGIMGAGVTLSQSVERQSRLQNYMEQVVHIESDQFVLEQGYQAQQAQIAVAQGQLFGVGIGKSSQRDFLPAPYNDFIFSIITEEYGLFGAMFVLLLYTVILVRGVAFIARSAPDQFGLLMAVACTMVIAVYAFVNAAVATGLFPVTGLPMPFVSYGGTSMLFSGMMIGVLMNISKQTGGGDD